MTRMRNLERRGLSLIETLVVTVIAIILLIVIYSVMTRGMELADSSSRSIQLQQGARNLLENMVRDINSSHAFANASPEGFVVLKYQYDDPFLTTAENTKSPGLVTFPFFVSGGVTEFRLPVFQCSYVYFKDKQIVKRYVKKNTLLSATPSSGAANENILKFSSFDMKDAGTAVKGEPADGRIVARNVKAFNLSYFGYDEETDGQLKELSQIKGRDLEQRVARVAMLLVHFRAEFDEGLYKDTLKSPEIEVMTKIWSYKHVNDHVYKEYFSSQDEDTRF